MDDGIKLVIVNCKKKKLNRFNYFITRKNVYDNDICSSIFTCKIHFFFQFEQNKNQQQQKKKVRKYRDCNTYVHAIEFSLSFYDLFKEKERKNRRKIHEQTVLLMKRHTKK